MLHSSASPIPAGAVVLALLAAGCTAGPQGADPADAPGPLVSLLCQPDDLADTDPAAARGAFEQAHLELHDLADEASGVDRAAAADLLRAKQRVEAGFSAPTLPPDMADRLQTLAEATAAALTPTGAPPPACPPTP